MAQRYLGTRKENKMIKRLITNEQKEEIKSLAKFKEKDLKNLSDKEIREIIIIIAKKLRII